MFSGELVEKIARPLGASYDVERNHKVGDVPYDVHAFLDVTNARYVLIKKAELWRANCYEHIFIKNVGPDAPTPFSDWTPGFFEKLEQTIAKELEPNYVRQGEKNPPKDHMYTYLTFIYVADKTPPKEWIKTLRRFRYRKEYALSFRGYCEARVLLFDAAEQTIYGNRAAGDLIKGYQKQENLWR